MPSQVFYMDLRSSLKRPFDQKMDELIEAAGLPASVKPGGLTAIKLHFGERGNTAFIRPVHARRFVEAIKAAGGQPFLTDCNTLYVGARADSASHQVTAIENGFAYSVVQAPIVIADGLRGQDYTAVKVGLPEAEEVFIGSAVTEADSLVCLTHFKGHELCGFGGSLKNLGMGCGSRQGKLFMHSNITPGIDAKKCIACGACIKRCPVVAIKLSKRGKDEPAPEDSQNPKLKAIKDPEKCIGCGDCILACPTEAIEIQWDAEVPDLMRRMIAYTKGVLQGKEERSVFFNFITQVSPACDCYPHQDAPIVADLGIVASRDPVAIDQASADLVNQAAGSPHSCLKNALAPGSDKFKDLYPKIDWEFQLDYAAQIGLGSREYQLVKI